MFVYFMKNHMIFDKTDYTCTLGHSIITLSHNDQNLDPPSPIVHTCSMLVTPSREYSKLYLKTTHSLP